MKRIVKNLAKRLLAVVHSVGLKFGLVILPDHYYTPIANIHDLAASRQHWAHRAPMTGVTMDVKAQAALLAQMVQPFEPEYRGNTIYSEGYTQGFGPGFGYVEAQCFHGVLRSLKPRRIFEVGSGVSTYCALKASALNAGEGAPTELVCIEPYPSAFLQGAAARKEIRLVQAQVQNLDPAIFDELEAGDLLFIDSTHAVKPGGDVIHLYLEVIPRLKPGVVVHIHDIYLPYVYQRDVLKGLFQWSETALLLALMTNNTRLQTMFCLSLLHYDAPEALKAVFPEYEHQAAVDGLCSPTDPGHFPASIYLQTS